jgi:hypothetical protein
MTFRVYECRYPFTPEKPTYEYFSYHEPQYHFDTGKVFSITTEDARDVGETEISSRSIARVMLKKLYGFGGNFANQWYVSDWHRGKAFEQGTIHGVWYIKRVV